jgi:hypothetical protein
VLSDHLLACIFGSQTCYILKIVVRKQRDASPTLQALDSAPIPLLSWCYVSQVLGFQYTWEKSESIGQGITFMAEVRRVCRRVQLILAAFIDSLRGSYHPCISLDLVTGSVARLICAK